MPFNDNNPHSSGMTDAMPDPHGQAALLLVESLIHALLERSIISIGEAIDVVETAASVQIDVAEAADPAGAPMWRSHTLLDAIIQTLRLYDDSGSTPIGSGP